MLEVSSVLAVASDAITALNADGDNGFNPLLIKACANYNIDPFQIDFTDNSSNFFRSRFGILDLYETDEASLPAVTLYESGDENTNEEIFAIFSGPVHFTQEVHLVWEAPNAKGFERLRYAVHDTILNLFNGDFAQSIFQTAYGAAASGACLVFNGRIGMQRPAPMVFVAESGVWLQTLEFPILLRANTD